VLFDEVPGCATCVSYGDQVLSHPLIVEAAETLFLPVAVYNNVGGDDGRVLKSFNEPAWNNPVVRILSPARGAESLRLAGDYTAGGLAGAMVSALKAAGRPVPTYLGLLAEETGRRERAVFAMHCFWEGEATLDRLPGVVSTRPGFVAGMEVVEVEFNPRALPYDKLLDQAMQAGCATRAFTRDDRQQAAAARRLGGSAVRSKEAIRPDREPKYYLSKTPLRHLPMTPVQAARVNAALGRNGQAEGFLSPRQLELLGKISRHPKGRWPDAIGVTDLPAAWRAAQDVARRLP
jgi:hypothetical protein